MNTKTLSQSKSFLVPILALVISAIIVVAVVIIYINIHIFTNHMKLDIETKEHKYLEKRNLKFTIAKENNKAVITIQDNGGDIFEDVLPKIFDPYFITKHQSSNTGLSLHMSRDIIENHLKGTITAPNTSKGAKFTTKLPIQ